MAEDATDTRCLIWSHEHSAWWGPCSRGYTKNLTLAGIYSREEAMEIVERATFDWTKAPNEVVVRVADVPTEAWSQQSNDESASKCCPRCNQVLQRCTHGPNYTPPAGRGYYEFWFKCENPGCRTTTIMTKDGHRPAAPQHSHTDDRHDTNPEGQSNA